MSRHVVITGASSGIGKATDEMLHDKGYSLTLISRSEDKLKALSIANSDRVLIGSGSVLDYGAMHAIVEQSVAKFGGVDVLLNNAGLGYFDVLSEGKIEEWQEMIDTNVKGVLNLLHICLPHLIQRKGHVVNLGSVASHHVFPESGIYCASKWALRAISESIRVDLKDQVSVTTISPGQVDTNFVNVMSNEKLKEKLAPVFRDGLTPESIAESILFAIEMDEKSAISEVIIRPRLK